MRIFTTNELMTTIAHMKARCPEVLSMIENYDLKKIEVSQEDWTKALASSIPIINELGFTSSLAEMSSLQFNVRKKLREMNGLSV